MQAPASSTAPEELSSLVRAVAQAVDNWIDEGSLTRVRTAVVVADPVYTTGSLNWGYRTEEREQWDDVKLQQLLQKLLEDEASQSDLEKVVGLVATQVGIAEDRIPTLRGDLRQFLLAAARRAAADDLGALDEGGLANRFVDEVGGGELNWRGNVWLQGLVVEGDPLEVGNGTVLRQPVSSDFAFERPAESALFGAGIDHLMKFPDCVLEMSRSAVKRPDHEMYRIANSLCLYDLGAVTPVQHGFRSDSLFRPSHTSRPHTRLSPVYRYAVSQEEVSRLRDFISKVSPVLPEKPTGRHGDNRWNGLKFYFRALFNATDNEERASLSVASLESILTAGIRQELSFRLSQRAAGLLRLVGLKPLEVFEDVKRAYKIRSAYDHGEQASVDPQELSSLCTRIMNYARLTALKALDADGLMSRRDLGVRLDTSLLDNQSVDDLERDLLGGVWDLGRVGGGLDDGPFSSP